jgi:hypothetical protein
VIPQYGSRLAGTSGSAAGSFRIAVIRVAPRLRSGQQRAVKVKYRTGQ